MRRRRIFPRLAVATVALALAVSGCRSRDSASVAVCATVVLPSRHPDLASRWNAALERVRKNADDLAGWTSLARLSLAHGLEGPAEAALRECVRLQPAEPRWPYHLALWHAGYGRLAEAEPLFATVVRLAPDQLAPCIKYSDTLARLGRTEQATAVLEDWLKRHPGEVHALYGLGKLAFEQQDWVAARRWLEQAREADPTFGVALGLLATVEEKQGREAEAVPLRRYAASLGRYREPTDPWRDELLEDCFDPYRLQVAASSLGAAAPRGPADRWLQRALELDPQDARTPRQLGRLHLARREYETAAGWLEKAVALAPQHAPTYLDWIEALKNLKRIDEGERVIERGLAACPDSAGLNYEKALLLIYRQRQAEALPYLEKTIALEPERFMAYQTLASQLFRGAKYAEGYAVLQRGLVHHPRHPALLAMRLRFHIEAGQQEEAVRTWEEAKAAGVPEDALRELGALFTRRFRTAAPKL